MVNTGPDTMTGKFANGTTLLAAIPVYRSTDQPSEWVVVVERDLGEHGTEWVCALVDSLDATSWYWGHYYRTPVAALADMYVRAHVVDIPADRVREQADSDVISR